MEDIRICSLKEVSHIFRRPLAQVQILDRAHMLGQAYTNGAGSRYYHQDNINELAAAPRYDKASLSAAIRAENFPSDTAVVLRQVGPQAVNDDDARAWYGVDFAVEQSTDPEMRQQQTDASRMWWPVSTSNMEKVRALKDGEYIPMFITVGGMIAAARHIVGIDEELTATHPTLVAFKVEDAGDWFEKYRLSWLSSGPGKAILWW